MSTAYYLRVLVSIDLRVENFELSGQAWRYRASCSSYPVVVGGIVPWLWS